MPRTSIVILSYNNYADTTGPCIESVINNTDGDYELIIVDNASIDETKSSLTSFAKRHQNVKIRINEENRGFAGGNNDGIKMADGEYVILLNNDTLVPAGWLDRLLCLFKNHPDVGLIGPVTNSAGNEQCIQLENLNEHNYENISEEYIKSQSGVWFETQKLGFYCVAIRKSVIEKIGLLDEAFGIGMFEDDDYCLRARNAGYKLAIIEDCFVYHKGSVSFKKLSTREYQDIFIRNRMYYLKKHDVFWLYSDIAYSLWRKILKEFEGYKTSKDHKSLERIQCRLENMTGSLFQLRTAEENQAISQDDGLARLKLSQKQKKMMEISDWATELKKANDRLQEDKEKIHSELLQKTIELQNIKNSVWYNFYRWWGGKTTSS